MDQRRKQKVRKPRVRYFHWSKFDPSMVRDDGRPSHVEELTAYRDLLPELLRHEGQYVVMKGKTYKILPDRDAALRYSMEQYPTEDAMVMKIVAKQPIGSLGGAIL